KQPVQTEPNDKRDDSDQKNVDRFDQSDGKGSSRLELKPSLLDSIKDHIGDDGSFVQNECNRRRQCGNNRDKNHISAKGHSALQHNRNPIVQEAAEPIADIDVPTSQRL